MNGDNQRDTNLGRVVLSFEARYWQLVEAMESAASMELIRTRIRLNAHLADYRAKHQAGAAA